MGLYKAEFAWMPSGIEGSVVLADNEEEAKHLIEEDSGWNITWVDGDFPSEEEREWKTFGRIEKVTQITGVIYRGNYCC